MLIDKQALPMVAIDFMNEVHLEDVDIINELFTEILVYENDPSESNKQKVDELYNKWFEHTVNHFKGEEVEMEVKNFPPYPVHKGEHEYCLSRMDEVFKQWQSSNDIQVLKKYFIEELVPWLANHIQTMDTVTAMFFRTGLSPCAAH